MTTLEIGGSTGVPYTPPSSVSKARASQGTLPGEFQPRKHTHTILCGHTGMKQALLALEITALGSLSMLLSVQQEQRLRRETDKY